MTATPPGGDWLGTLYLRFARQGGPGMQASFQDSEATERLCAFKERRSPPPWFIPPSE